MEILKREGSYIVKTKSKQIGLDKRKVLEMQFSKNESET